jgi:hypothetical protein
MAGKETLLFTTRPSKHTQLHVKLVRGVKRPERETGDSCLSSAEVKNVLSCAYTTPIRLLVSD